MSGNEYYNRHYAGRTAGELKKDSERMARINPEQLDPETGWDNGVPSREAQRNLESRASNRYSCTSIVFN
jgi:hypothetical protein